DPDRMVVHMFEPFAQRALRPAAVVRNLEDHVRDVDAVNVLRIADDLSVIHTLRDGRTHPLPRRAFVVRTEDAASLPGRLDRGVDDVRFDSRHGQPDSSQFARGQSPTQPPPRPPAVAGFLNPPLTPPLDHPL